MSEHGHADSAHTPVPAKTFLWVWIFLVALTGIEVYLGYIELEPHLMLGILMGLSLIKAGLIMSWFMHLKYEKRGLTLWLIPATVFCIGMMMAYFFWDSIRLGQLRPH
jgi:cytochrome c oxidase subunit 4